MRAVAIVFLVACGSDAADPTLFPADYASTFTEVRTCRQSVDHDLHNIRILAAADAVTAYNDRVTAFPDGAVIVKEEYARTDTTCAGAIVELTAMQRAGTDWRWQRTSADLEPIAIEAGDCSGCHAQCPGGYAGTCATP